MATLELAIICLTQLSSNSATVTRIYEKHTGNPEYFDDINTPLNFARQQWLELVQELDEYFGHLHITKLEDNLWDAFDRFCWGNSNSVRNSEQFPPLTDRYSILQPDTTDATLLMSHGDIIPRKSYIQEWSPFSELGANALKRVIQRGIKLGAPNANGYYLLSFAHIIGLDFEVVRDLADVDYCVAPQKSYHPLLGVSNFPEEWKAYTVSTLLGRLQATLDFVDKDGTTLLGIALNTVSLICIFRPSPAGGRDNYLTGFYGKENLRNSIDWVKVLWKHGARACQLQHDKLVFVDADLEFDDGDHASGKDTRMVKAAASRWRRVYNHGRWGRMGRSIMTRRRAIKNVFVDYKEV